MVALPAPLPSRLELERVLTPGRTWRVRERCSGHPLVLRRCFAARRLVERRLQRLSAATPAASLVLERELVEAGGELFSLRPFVDGQPLADVLWRRSGTPADCPGLALVLAVAERVSEWHRRGLAHGRLHGHNVLVDDAGRVHLVDALDPVPPRAPSGSPAGVSAAPERLRGAAPSPRGDVYGLGVMLFELCAGRHPFAAPETLESLRRALYEQALLSPEEEQRLPAALAALVRRATARHPLWRPAHAGRMAAALRSQQVPGPVGAEPHPDLALPPAALLHAHGPSAGELPPAGPGSRLQLSASRAISRAAASVFATLSAARVLALRGLDRWGHLRRSRQLTVAALLLAGALAALGVSRVAADRSLEQEVEHWLEARQPARARQVLEAARAERQADAPLLDKLLGDVRCAEGAHDECLQHYQRVLERSGRHASDERLRRNTLALLAHEDRRWRVAAVAAHLDGVEDVLVEGTRSEHYWRRWNSVRALEARGAHGDIDYPLVHALDVLHAGSCATRRAALARLVQLGDPAALPHLEQARERSRGKLFGDFCLGNELERAIRALEEKP